MRLAVDSYLARRFHRVRSHCGHMTRDAWLELTGQDIGERSAVGLAFDALAARNAGGAPDLERLAGPADPCIVLMRSPGVVPHCGVLYRGRLLQLTQRGASWLPLDAATKGFADVSFYR